MTTFPRVTCSDGDVFEERLSDALDNADPQEIVEAIRRACQYIERVAEDANLDMNQINNATSTCCRGAMRLAGKLQQIKAITKETDA